MTPVPSRSELNTWIADQIAAGVLPPGYALPAEVNPTLPADASATPDVPPAAPAGLTATAVLEGILFEWTNPADEDFTHSELFVNSTASKPGTASYVIPGIPSGKSTFRLEPVASGQTRYGWVDAIDRIGNRSSTSAGPANATATGIDPTVAQNSQSANYTLELSDSGKHIYHPSADTTPRTFTIPANGSVPYPLGTALTFVNGSGAGTVTIACNDTMRLAGPGTTGSRTLAANGIATALKVTTTSWLINGTGLT